MANDNIKDRLLDDLEALRSELSADEQPGEDEIPTLDTENIPTLTPVVETTTPKDTLAALDSELEEIIPAEEKQTDDAEPEEDLSDATGTETEEALAPETEEALASEAAEHVDDQGLGDDTDIDLESEEELDIPSLSEQAELAADQEASAEAEQEHNEEQQLSTEEDSKEQESNEPVSNIEAPILEPSTTQGFSSMNTTEDPPSQFKKDVAPEAKSNTVDDNPFLPKHLRERLNQSKSELMEDFARSTDALNASSQVLRSYTAPGEEQHPLAAPGDNKVQSSHKDLIDSLVAQYLPIIEADLRKRLEESLKDK